MAKNRETSGDVDLDAILTELGPWGAFKWRNYCLIILPIMFSAIYNGQYVFNAGNPNYRCLVPECESSPPKWIPGEWGQWALPEGDLSSCERRVPVDSSCKANSFLNSTQECTSWLYETNNTIVAEFDLACQEWRRTLVGSIHSAGLFTALIFIGFISDTVGRRHTFIITATLPALAGLARAYSTSYSMYVALEYLEALSASGAYTTGYILALEMVDLDKRVIAGSGMSTCFASGQIVLALMAWLFPYWRTLTIVLYVPSFFFIFYYLWLVESVRWLLSKGKKMEAARIIFKAAAANGRQLSEETIRQLTTDIPAAQLNVKEQQFGEERSQRPLWVQVLRSRILMTRLVICSFWFISVTFIYYGLSINSVTLAGNKYVNYGLTAIVEVPGYIISIMTLDRFGRKHSIITAFFVCGVALITMPFVTSTRVGVQLGLSLIGKFASSMAISGIYVYSLEMFPTDSRHGLLAICCLSGRLGLLLAPYSPLLMRVSPSLPYLVFGVLAWCAGALMLITPETLHAPLPDTVAQAERLSASPATRTLSKPPKKISHTA